jgi:ribonuclease T2
MQDRKYIVSFIGAALLLLLSPAHARKHHRDPAPAQQRAQGGSFDYYLMSLSWSPSSCTTHPQEREQCSGQGYGFVLHRLWPQYLSGNGPQRCSTDAKLDAETVRKAMVVSPSHSLIQHEWQTHGSCSGLSAAQYFGDAERAFEAIHVPRELVSTQSAPRWSARDVADAFVTANPGLQRDMLAVKCDGMKLSEVRVCLSKDALQPQRCGARVATQCHNGTLEIPLAKGQR